MSRNRVLSKFVSNVTANLTPLSDNVYSLGTVDNRWKDIFVTGGSIILGNVALKDNEGTLATSAVESNGYIVPAVSDVGTGSGGNVIVSDNAPNTSDTDAGTIWVNNTNSKQFILFSDGDSNQWVEIGSESFTAFNVKLSNTAPNTDATVTGTGTIWIDSANATQYVLLEDEDSRQWIELGTNKIKLSNIAVTLSADAPNVDNQINGTVWVDTDDGTQYLLIEDADGKQWVEIGSGAFEGGSSVTQSNAEILTNISGVNNLSTSFLSVPTGTYDQRVDAYEGSLRYNSSNTQLEVYLQGNWTTLKSVSIEQADYLVVAGGAGGGGGFNNDACGGGGGAGGVLSGNITTASYLASGENWTITVGTGGSGGTATPGNFGGQGGNTTLTVSGTDYLAQGGGGGTAYPDTAGKFGASGGGAGGAGGSTQQGGGSIPGQGNDGGDCVGTGQSNNSTSAGGGGGASTAGGNGTANSTGGSGGNGYTWVNNAVYGGGGGGGARAGGGPGGTGGGGDGGPGTTGAGSNGTDGHGGGGGGGSAGEGNAIGGDGGDGTVIIRYLGSTQKATGGDIAVINGWTYHTFNTSGTFSIT